MLYAIMIIIYIKNPQCCIRFTKIQNKQKHIILINYT